jgi:hypothetical protein
MSGPLAFSVAFGASRYSPACVSSQRFFRIESVSHFHNLCSQISIRVADYGLCSNILTFSLLSGSSCPINAKSFHSYINRLAILLLPSCFMKFTSMNGSTSPPHDALLYIPEHRCWFSAFWSYTCNVSQTSGSPANSTSNTYEHNLHCIHEAS